MLLTYGTCPVPTHASSRSEYPATTRFGMLYVISPPCKAVAQCGDLGSQVSCKKRCASVASGTLIQPMSGLAQVARRRGRVAVRCMTLLKYICRYVWPSPSRRSRATCSYVAQQEWMPVTFAQEIFGWTFVLIVSCYSSVCRNIDKYVSVEVLLFSLNRLFPASNGGAYQCS